MAPKRKADATAGQSAPKAKKRSTAAADSPAKSSRAAAASSSSSKARVKGASATASSSSKSKSKNQAEITIVESDSSGDDDSDSDVIIESPKKGKKTTPSSKGKGASKSTKDENDKKKKSVGKASDKAAEPSKAALASLEPLDSTSTPGDTTPVAGTKAKKGSSSSKSKSTKPLSFEDGFERFFAAYAEEGTPDKMEAEGIEQLFQDMSLSMDGSYPMLLAYKVKAEPGSFGSFLRSDFKRAFKAEKIASPTQLSASLQKLYDTILDPASSTAADFRDFYSFLFPFLRSEGAKTLPAEMAIPLWSISIAQRYELGQSFVDFAESQGLAFKAVSVDVWTQLLEFCQSVEPDLTGWSEDDAWPSTIDAFVEWKKAQSA
ncbi:hypothetical protein JCM8115_006489 [Rhodotorula mucilaginosa]|uniref:Defective in cullin neddylation protein n=1 Tax=Rhodotorula mucilaginosa TaxID=5537 RepID=A0A9P7B9A4_RHOMI|nr:hypothetical protein C6P46_005959 [Rhodotorula mucilaginosa]